MMPDRISLQYSLALKEGEECIIGGNFERYIINLKDGLSGF
jgi:hypothetical protein